MGGGGERPKFFRTSMRNQRESGGGVMATQKRRAVSSQSLSLLLGIWMGKSPSFSRLFFLFYFGPSLLLFPPFHHLIVDDFYLLLLLLFHISHVFFFSSTSSYFCGKTTYGDYLTVNRGVAHPPPPILFKVVCVICIQTPKGVSIIRLVHQASYDITQQARNSFHNVIINTPPPPFRSSY